MPLQSFDDLERQRQVFMRSRHGRQAQLDTSPDRVYELIRAGMRDGSITDAHQLAEHQLVEAYGASRNSVRRALQKLAEEGLLRRAPRAGTNLTRDFVSIPLSEIGPRAWAGTSYGGRLHVRTLTCEEVTLAPELQRRLQVERDTAIVVEQVGTLDESPLYFRIGFCATSMSAGDYLAQLDSLHETYPPLPTVFATLFGREYGTSQYSVEAIAASARAAEELDIPVGAPTLLRELTTVDTDGRPGELSFTYFAPGRVALTGDGTFRLTQSTTGDAVEVT